MRSATAPISATSSDMTTTAKSSPPRRAATSRSRRQPRRDRDQPRVAGGMAVGVVNDLEPVEIEAKQRNPGGGAGLAGTIQHLVEQHPVRQLGQAVMPGEKGDLLLLPPLPRDVRPDPAIADKMAKFIE